MISDSHRLVLAGLLLLLVGCTKTTPVEEISVQASGVSLSDSDVPDLSRSWPGWRGPERNGHAPDQDLPVQWNESKNVLWRTDIPGRGHSSPVVIGDQVLLATADDADQEQLVVAYNRQDGTVRWETVVHEGGFPSPGELHKKGTNANGTLLCDGERIFAVFLNSGKIIATALDLKGKQLWQQELGAFNSKFGYAPSPLLYKSFVIIAADNRGGGYIAALDRKSGKIAWRVARPAVSTYSSPVVAHVGGRDQLLISGCDAVTSYDPATGKENWSTPCLAEATCGTIVTSADKIFASGGYPKRETVGLSADGKLLWTDKTKIYEPSLLVDGDFLYGVTDDGIAYCWSTETGDVKWRNRLRGSFSASPILCNGLIYVSNLSGETFVFKATPDGYEEVGFNKIGDDCYASPAAADGELFLRIGKKSSGKRQEQLVCITGPEETKAAETKQAE
ncbi:outer membrane biogenesis protein BamB [Gimesia panareensis]|uniref:Outer membrane biogenesis protein BamB n=1 Tax=Gimesia panareensis TaxID=2527978 RepID=A0A517Q5V1_9PLAN|nr:PQQ-binding-like beta-propeller repeat protein [Gimesia panareensis]QDT26974.1 outer membrane biogenesis protein BamB [Gimesia panareensis]